MGRKKDKVVEKTPQEVLVETLDAQLFERLDIFECSKLGLDKRLAEVLEKDTSKIDSLEVESGNTALMLASKNGFMKCVRLLLEKGANVNAGGFYNLTALHYAARNDRDEICQVLVDSAADINAEDKAGNTPAHDGARMGNLKCVEVLLNAGADLEHANASGSSLFTATCLNARGALVDILFKKPGLNIDRADNKGDTALHMCAAAGLDRICNQLLTAGANKELTNNNGQTPADLAVTEDLRKKLS